MAARSGVTPRPSLRSRSCQILLAWAYISAHYASDSFWLAGHRNPIDQKIPRSSLVFEDQDQYDWWHRGGPVLAKLMRHADYNVHKQYEYLVLFAYLVVPFLGPSPENGRRNLYPPLVDLEFSQNFQQNGCITRIAFQPAKSITSLSERDPLKRLATYEVLVRLFQMDGVELDLTLYHHCMSSLSLTSTEERYLLQQNSREPLPPVFRTQSCIALNLQKNGNARVKFYSFLLGKALVSQAAASDLAFGSIRTLHHGNALFGSALRHVEDYLRGQYTGGITGVAPASPSSFHPTGVVQMACDLVPVERSRFKVYLQECLVKFERVVDIWTLGGRLPLTPESNSALEILRTVWSLLKIREGYHFPAEMAARSGADTRRGSNGQAGSPSHLDQTFFDGQFLMFNYEFQPGDPCPRPQIYFPLSAMSYTAVTDAVVALFVKLGWTEHANAYRGNVAEYYPSAGLDETSGLQYWLSFSFSAITGPYTSIYYRRIGG
ncbi:putative dimethylallyl tryptophan synthase [Aspergillus californicus]